MITRDLIGTSLRIRQEQSASFNLDTILLQAFVSIPKTTKHIVDIGTGNLAIALYLSTKTNASITAIEIIKSKAENALYNAKLNHLENQITVIHGDVTKEKTIKDASMIVCNPPFFKVDHNRLNDDLERMIQRHEVALTLEQLFDKSYQMLKDQGILYMIHRPDRLFEIAHYASKYRLQIKEIKFIHPYLHKSPNHVLIKCVKHGKEGLNVLPPFILYEKQGVMSHELKKLYETASF